MSELTGERKVYSEFFTNLAVAWFSAGVISPFFTKPKSVVEILLFASFGILGALASLRSAVLISKGGKR
mgnify:FL=1